MLRGVEKISFFTKVSEHADGERRGAAPGPKGYIVMVPRGCLPSRPLRWRPLAIRPSPLGARRRHAPTRKRTRGSVPCGLELKRPSHGHAIGRPCPSHTKNKNATAAATTATQPAKRPRATPTQNGGKENRSPDLDGVHRPSPPRFRWRVSAIADSMSSARV